MVATQAAAILVAQLATWLIVAYAGFALLLWPFAARGVVSAFTDAGSSLFTLGFAVPAGGAAVIVFLAAAVGLVILTLQIAYLPTLYAAFICWETQAALLNSRGGFPSWGPELLARTHYALGSGTSTLDTMPELYAQWERWAADVGESHTTYLPLVRFRSPAALLILDAGRAGLRCAVPGALSRRPRRRSRPGCACAPGSCASTGSPGPWGSTSPMRPTRKPGISLTYGEFLEAVNRMREVDFPIEREPAQAWPEFVGWRVNYERAAYAIAAAVYAVPAKWSGPRRYASAEIPPVRPGRGRPPT